MYQLLENNNIMPFQFNIAGRLDYRSLTKIVLVITSLVVLLAWYQSNKRAIDQTTLRDLIPSSHSPRPTKDLIPKNPAPQSETDKEEIKVRYKIQDIKLQHKTHGQPAANGTSIKAHAQAQANITQHKAHGQFLGLGRTSPFIDTLTLEEVQTQFHQEMLTMRYNCSGDTVRYGAENDGGYELCMDDKFHLKKNDCLVYSFGISNEWSFDEAVNTEYNCDVHSFDPSMKMGDHIHREPNMFFHHLGLSGSTTVHNDWQLMDLTRITQMLNHTDRIIDVLKVDIEGSEWPFLANFIDSGIHQKVRQLVFELHTPVTHSDGPGMRIADYSEIYNSFDELNNVGYKRFLYHTRNNCCGWFHVITPETVAGTPLCCYEQFFVNVALNNSDKI